METQRSTKLFTDKSEAYAKYRAGYPDEAIDLILAPFEDQDVIQVVDVGAGTGIGSQLLAEKGAKVTAVEPNQAMIDSAISHPHLTFRKAPAENLPLPDDFADAVTSFQAFHWFNFSNSLKEFRRVLKPTGQLALAWNYWDVQDPFTAAYVKLIDEATQKNEERVEPYSGFWGQIKKFRVRLLWKFQILPYYKNVKRHTYRLVQKMDLDGLIGCAESQSYIQNEGPLWDDLQANIITLANKHNNTDLVYAINVFTANPVK